MRTNTRILAAAVTASLALPASTTTVVAAEPPPSTGEAKVPLTGEREATMAAVRSAFADMEFSAVDGVRVRYPEGWFLCRPSNTEPILVMRAEAGSTEALAEIRADVDARMAGIIDLANFHAA